MGVNAKIMEYFSFKCANQIARFIITNETLCTEDYIFFGHCLCYCFWHSDSKQVQTYLFTIMTTTFLETSLTVSVLFYIDSFKSISSKWFHFDMAQLDKFLVF